MDITEAYLAKHSFKPAIQAEPLVGSGICVVIPCYNECHLTDSLQSLWNCARPSVPAEVIVVVNSPENSAPEILTRNLETLKEATQWIEGHQDARLRFYLMHKPDLPHKFAGVGLARKTGMDEAAFRLNRAGSPKGIIACFDADATCQSNYQTEIEQHFKKYTRTPGASIYFEHPLSGEAFETSTYRGICLYELHLRYLNQALRYSGHPHAFHTVGSSMAVRADAYVKQGGMNKRQAGEDFYFLQKLIALGNFTEINTTTVFPSPRESNRVPFGTGASMLKWKTENVMPTYSLKAYEDIQDFIRLFPEFFNGSARYIATLLSALSPVLMDFLTANEFTKELESIQNNSASPETFRDRFFRWFNAFRVIKYLNFSHEKFYTKCDIVQEASLLLDRLNLDCSSAEPEKLLEYYRIMDKSGFGLTSR